MRFTHRVMTLWPRNLFDSEPSPGCGGPL
jgi:hypothetical protein